MMIENQEVLYENEDVQAGKSVKVDLEVKDEIKTERFDVRISPELKKTLKELGKSKGMTQPDLMNLLYNSYAELETLKTGESDEDRRVKSELVALDRALAQVKTIFLSQIKGYQFELESEKIESSALENDLKDKIEKIKSELEQEIDRLERELNTEFDEHQKEVIKLQEKHEQELSKVECQRLQAENEHIDERYKMNVDIKRYKEDIAIKESFIKRQAEVIESNKNELNALKESLTNKEQQLNKLKDEVESIEATKTALICSQDKNKEMEDRIRILENEKERLEQSLGNASKQVEFYSSQVSEIRNDYNLRIESIEKSYREQIENLKEQCSFYKAQFDNKTK